MAFSNWAGVSMNTPHAIREHGLQAQALAERSAKHFGHSGDKLIDIYYFRGKWLLTRKGEKPMCKKCSPFSPVERAVNETFNTVFATGQPTLQYIQTSDNNSQHVIEVVGNSTC